MADFAFIVAGIALTFSLLRLAEHLQTRHVVRLVPINAAQKRRRS
jgi:hypothetical protein